MQPMPHRPLPRQYVDLLTSGISKQELKASGDRAVDRALMRTALSAVGRGWARGDWLCLIQDPRCTLAQQAKLHNGRPRGDEKHARYLGDIWERALKAHRPQGKGDKRVFAAEAESLIREWDAWLTEHPASLDNIDVLIVCAFLDKIASVGSRRVAYGRQRLLDETQLPEYDLRQRLDILHADKLLECVERGVPSGPYSTHRRANVYVLCDPATFVAKRGVAMPEADVA